MKKQIPLEGDFKFRDVDFQLFRISKSIDTFVRTTFFMFIGYSFYQSSLSCPSKTLQNSQQTNVGTSYINIIYVNSV